ncbi:MAG: hypothetical protein F6K28_24430 [Microcoleus sp. SIO2G3]|nr:hypothetical protein [Microcoleus sp. SIO2G3]
MYLTDTRIAINEPILLQKFAAVSGAIALFCTILGIAPKRSPVNSYE